MAAGKHFDFITASWKPQKSTVYFLSKSKALETQKSQWFQYLSESYALEPGYPESWHPWAGKVGVPVQPESKCTLPLSCCSLILSVLDKALLLENSFLSSVYWFKCWSLLETLSKTHSEIMFYYLHLLSWHMKWTITGAVFVFILFEFPQLQQTCRCLSSVFEGSQLLCLYFFCPILSFPVWKPSFILSRITFHHRSPIFFFNH